MNSIPFKIDLNVLNHLGMGLYSNTPAVLTEIISNAWDADARNVSIDLFPDRREVEIKDDGHGMSIQDIQDKFLNVGYARREDGRSSSPEGRQVMGRKGIGKLAMFSLANKITVYTKTEDGSAHGFVIKVDKLRNCIRNGVDYEADYEEVPHGFSKGTKIILSELNKSIDKTENYLRKRLARRFSVIGPANDFHVHLNGSPIDSKDRDFYSDVEFIWFFGDKDQTIIDLCSNLKNHKVLDSQVQFDGKYYSVSGYIASVSKPSALVKDHDVSNNTITVMANGRVFEEDLLKHIDSSRIFVSYLVGEVVADFLDQNDMPDMATSSRQQLQQNDPRYTVLKSFLERNLETVDSNWDEWRRARGAEEEKGNSAALSAWLDRLKPREKKAAENLIGKINTMRFGGGPVDQLNSKREVLKSSILAFEKLRIKGNLDALDKIGSVDSTIFSDIFDSVDEVEASLFYDITQQRLKVVEKFDSLTSDDTLEKVVQDYLYEHLWLLDPSWERSTGESDYERTLTKELRQVQPDTKEGARIDIGYKTIPGHYLIIEMKRPSAKIALEDLVSQGRRYSVAVKQWYRQRPGLYGGDDDSIPPIEVVFLVGKVDHIDFSDEFVVNQLRSIRAKVISYKTLISQSRNSLNEYLNAQNEVGMIKKLVEEI